MPKLEVHKRIGVRALAATADELDELAASLAVLTGSTGAARWRIAHRDFDTLNVEGSLAELAESVDLARVRSFTLRVGRYNEPQRITVEGGVLGLSADIWGESAGWVNDAVAVVERRLTALRPWWWRTRTSWAAAGYAGIIAISALVLLTWVGQPVTDVGGGLLLGLVGAVIGGIIALSIPPFRLGERRSGAKVARTVLWGTVYLLIGAVLGAVVSGAYNAVFAAQ